MFRTRQPHLFVCYFAKETVGGSSYKLLDIGTWGTAATQISKTKIEIHSKISINNIRIHQYRFSSVSLWKALAIPIRSFVRWELASTPSWLLRYSIQNCESAMVLPLYSIHGVLPFDENFALWSFCLKQ